MANAALVAQNIQFERQIIEVSPKIWGAIGYALSNVFMIEGRSSATVIDTTESTKAAENILAEFRKLTDKPIKRIVYTHGHRDHIGGASIFATESDVAIYASKDYKPDMLDIADPTTFPEKAMEWRAKSQFGANLSDAERLSHGAGPADRPKIGLGAGYVPPTVFVDDGQVIDLDGIRARFVLAPGETDDHVGLWLPELKLLFSADNWYHAFPNLYTIRGTLFRSYHAWADSLGKFADLEPEILAPGHSLPVYGGDAIQEVLRTTQAAIIHIMRETTRLMDQGVAWDDIPFGVTLPPELADKPWLQEFYGKVSWSARGYAHGILGWYDGNPTNLATMPTQARAAHMAALAGGTDKLMAAAEASTDPQWTLELCDHLMRLGMPASELKAKVMTELGEEEINANARNSYLSEAKRLRDGGGARG